MGLVAFFGEFLKLISQDLVGFEADLCGFLHLRARDLLRFLRGVLEPLPPGLLQGVGFLEEGGRHSGPRSDELLHHLQSGGVGDGAKKSFTPRRSRHLCLHLGFHPTSSTREGVGLGFPAQFFQAFVDKKELLS